MSNELNPKMIPNIKESYINRRIASLNSKSENLKESKTEEQIYKEMKKKYIDKSNEDSKIAREKVWKREEEEIKKILIKAKSEYEIEEVVIEEIVKMLYQKNSLTPIFLEYVINVCNISNIRDIERYKQGKKAIGDLLEMQFAYEII